MRRVLAAILTALALAGCGTVPTAQAPQSAAPTIVPTAVPLDQLDLESLLIQSGDLPAGMSGAQVSDTAPKMFDGVPKAVRVFSQQIAQDGKQIGGVNVFLYSDEAARKQAYAVILDGFGTAKAVEGVGDEAQMTETKPDSLLGGFADVLFARCHAVAHIRMTGPAVAQDQQAAVTYAKRLDKRLSTVVC